MNGPMASFNRYRFSSKEVHVNSGLYSYGYRYYEPYLQRWLNQDPIGEAGGMNLYRFVRNKRVGLFDRDGLAPQMSGFTSDRNGKSVSPGYSTQGYTQGDSYWGEGPLGIPLPVYTYPPGFGHDYYADEVVSRARHMYWDSLPKETPFVPDSRGIETDDDIFALLLPFLPKTARITCPTRQVSKYLDRTKPGSRFPNRGTDVTRAELEKNLSESGWSKSVSKDGKVTNFEKDGARYSVREGAKSTGGPTADYYKKGSQSPDLKIRLDEP